MGKRRRARESALQILYQLEFEGSRPDSAVDFFWQKKRAPAETREYSRWLVEGILDKRKDVDEAIQSVSQHWRIERMAVVDRNILRLAAFELLNSPHTAPAVVINEAIEIAKKFSCPEAATFVNGILDALRRKIQAADKPGREVNNVPTGRATKKAGNSRRSQKD
jgi:N utilization substance protein B